MDGKTIEKLQGQEAAKIQENFTSSPGATQQLIVKSSDGNGQVVELLSSSVAHLLATVYITPPFQLNTSNMLATGARLGAFTKDNKFVCYELGLAPGQA